MKGKRVGCTLIWVGVVLVILGLVIQFLIFPPVFQSSVYEEMWLEEGTEAWSNLLEPPAPIHMKFTFFNVENPDEIQAGGKPRVSERGPYAYREYRKKHNLVNLNGDTLQYEQTKQYVYDDDETIASNCVNGLDTPCARNDNVTVVNGALLGVVATVVEDLPPLLAGTVLRVLNTFITEGAANEDGLFHNVSVDDLLFQGYKPGVMAALIEVMDNLGITQQNLTDLGVEIPLTMAGGSFGMFKGRNNSREQFTIGTGKFVNNEYTSIKGYQGKPKLPDFWWPNAAPRPSLHAKGVEGVCRDMIGTDGLQYHQFVSQHERLWLFDSDLCRSIWLDFDRTIMLQGIKLLRFRPPAEVFDMKNFNNYCYCPEFDTCAIPNNNTDDEWDPTECFQHNCMDGVLKVSGCNQGQPVIMTAPHFYNCYPDLAMEFDGLDPSFEKHDTTIDVEEYTGAAMQVHKKVQISLPMIRTDSITVLQNVRNNIFPIFWLDEGGGLDKVSEKKFKDMLMKPIQIVEGISYGLGVALGSALIVVGIGMIVFFKRRERHV